MMKKPEDTETEHFCKTEKCWGQVWVALISNNNKWFCGYCNKELRKSQLIPRWQDEYEIRLSKNQLNKKYL